MISPLRAAVVCHLPDDGTFSHLIWLSECYRRLSVAKPRGIEIVRRAYELWEQAGKPDGQDQKFYHQAERELTEAAALDADVQTAGEE